MRSISVKKAMNPFVSHTGDELHSKESDYVLDSRVIELVRLVSLAVDLLDACIVPKEPNILSSRLAEGLSC